MLKPYSRARPSRPRCAADEWAGAGWTLLEHHEVAVSAPPHTALAALAALRLRELPAVRALFRVRGLPHGGDITLRDFFTRAPFVALAEEPGRELVSGVLRPGAGATRRSPASAEAFRDASRSAPFAAVATFRADPRASGSLLWTETWVRARGARARVAFGAYWLAIGPWSAWIRRMFLRAARANAERAAPPGDVGRASGEPHERRPRATAAGPGEIDA